MSFLRIYLLCSMNPFCFTQKLGSRHTTDGELRPTCTRFCYLNAVRIKTITEDHRNFRLANIHEYIVSKNVSDIGVCRIYDKRFEL